MEFSRIKKWKSKMIGEYSNIDISCRLLMQAHFALIIITLVSSFFNYILDLGVVLSIVLLITALFYFFGYILVYSKHNFMMSFIVFVVVSLFLIFYIWINNGGIDGGNLLLVYAFYTILLFISRSKYAIYIIILYILTTMLLFYIELNFPEYIVGYETEKLRYIDIIIVSYLLYLLASPMLLFGKKLFEKAKTKAEESERSKMEFLANISHDVRTPLNAIIGFSELLNSEEINEADRKVFIHTIKTNSENLLHMVNNILNLSQIDSGLLKVEKSYFNLNSFMNMIFQTYNPLMVSDSVKLIMKNQISKENIEINSDQNLIYQVLTNLLNNSLKFTKEGEIIFGVKMENEIVFYVKDSGPGIAKEMQGIIFDRFRQVKRDNESQNKGVGLGLAICNDIVKLLGGKIFLESDEINGTTISFTIPV